MRDSRLKEGTPKGRTRETKGRRGRQQADIDPKKVQTMASYGCTVEEIAAVLDCSAKTLVRRFRGELTTGRNACNGTLRVMQFKLAAKSAAMAIFLGKNYLGQMDTFKFDRMTDEELIARAKEVGITIGDPGAAPSTTEAANPAEPKLN